MNTLTPQVRYLLCRYKDPRPLLEHEVFDTVDWLEVKGIDGSPQFVMEFEDRIRLQTKRRFYTLDDLALLEWVFYGLKEDIANGLNLCYTVTVPEKYSP